MKNFILLLSFMMFAGMMMGQALKVASNGYVGIGEPNPQQIMHVKGIAGTIFLETTKVQGNSQFVYKDPNGTMGAMGYLNNSGLLQFRQKTGSDIVWRFGAGVAMRLRNGTKNLTVAGDVTANGIMLTSDKRLKSNIKTFKSGLEQVMDLRPVSYTYNGKGGTFNDREHIGLIAQELQKTVPYMVSKFTHIKNEFDDIKSNVEEEFLAIHDSEIKYLLINAIQEQQKIIEDLQVQVADLQEVIGSVENNTIDNVDLVDAAQSTLGQNSPNPYNEGTVISYTVADNASSAKMKFYNLTGQLIKTISLQSGAGQLNISADELPSGTYTYSLEVDGAIISNKKMVKMR